MYHVMSRGNRRQDVFLDDIDRHDFLKTLAEACQKTGWQVHAYCFMSNHYHVVLETPNANLAAGMAWLQSTYTKNRGQPIYSFVFCLTLAADSAQGKPCLASCALNTQ
jgi:REP element-mobilizing transposase RayT